MEAAGRSGCPINLTLEMLGDRWSLIVIRDMMFGDRRHFRELLAGSEEGIASNILADRLKRLVAAGLLTRADDPTPQAEGDLQPDRAGDRARAAARPDGRLGPAPHAGRRAELSIRAQLLEEGGPPMWDAFMDELRALHLGAAAAGALGHGRAAGGLRGGRGGRLVSPMTSARRHLCRWCRAAATSLGTAMPWVRAAVATDGCVPGHAGSGCS